MSTIRPDRDPLVDAALSTLDAAPAAPLTPQQEARADDTLARILATPASERVPQRSPRSRVPARALLLVAAASVLALVASVTGILGGGTAYASWTARPSVLPSAQQEELAQQCRDYLSPGATGQDGTPYAADLQAADLVVADTRGQWSYVVLSGAAGLEATCLVEEARGLRHLLPGVGSSAGSYGFIAIPTPGPREIIGSGLMAMSNDEGSAWSTEGHLGGDVVAVTVLTETGLEVEATVVNGRFAAWWPQRETVDDTHGLGGVRYVATLRDGTVLPARSYDEIAPVPEE